MTIENNFSFIDIKKFVDNTLDVCMEDGIYSPVYYDYAFRCMCVTYFTDVDLSEMSNEDRMNWIYGEEYFEFLNSCGNKEKSLIDMLDKAYDRLLNMEDSPSQEAPEEGKTEAKEEGRKPSVLAELKAAVPDRTPRPKIHEKEADAR